MTRLIVETAGAGAPPPFGEPSAGLAYLLSFAVAEKFGSDHALGRAAGRLKRHHKVNLNPLLAFTEARAEDEVDRDLLEAAWQDPLPLAESVAAVLEALRGDAELQRLLKDFPEVEPRLSELLDVALWAADRGGQVRLTYSLD